MEEFFLMEEFFSGLKRVIREKDMVLFDTNFFDPFFLKDPLHPLFPAMGICEFAYSLATKGRLDNLEKLFNVWGGYLINLQSFVEEEKTRVTSGVLREQENTIRYLKRGLRYTGENNKPKEAWHIEQAGIKSIIKKYKELQNILREKRCIGGTYVYIPEFHGDDVDREFIGALVTLATDGYRVAGFSFDRHITYGIKTFLEYTIQKARGRIEIFGIEKFTPRLARLYPR